MPEHTKVEKMELGARELNRESPLPLWAQLEADLRRRIQAGEITNRFPTDKELTETYDISRHTAREAVRRLHTEGLVHRERGRGTVINKPSFEQPLGTLYSLFASIEAQGVTQHSQVTDSGIVQNAEAAAQLGRSEDSKFFHLARVRFAGNEPLALDHVWLPAEIARPLLDTDWSHTSLYRELEARCNIVPNSGWERITPVIPTKKEHAALHTSPNTAAFSIERLGCVNGTPLEWRTSLIRGDQYHVITHWSPNSTSHLRMLPSS